MNNFHINWLSFGSSEHFERGALNGWGKFSYRVGPRITALFAEWETGGRADQRHLAGVIADAMEEEDVYRERGTEGAERAWHMLKEWMRAYFENGKTKDWFNYYFEERGVS